MKKNKNKSGQYHPWKNEWSQQQWLDYVPEMQYSIKSVHELPPFILDNGLTKKFHSAIVACSASSESLFFSVTGYRPDKNATVIDEHPYIIVFDLKTADSYSGFIDHGNYSGRTETISPEMTRLIQLSGSIVPLSYSRIPTKPSGSLSDLASEGLINGIEYYFDRINKEREK